MIDLNNIYYFVKIVEHGSLTAAARALDVSKSILSQHLTKLEETLGVRLLLRSTRQMRTTDVGARYYENCRLVLEELERATSVIDDALAAPRGLVSVVCPPGFSETVLTPMLMDFMSGNPDVDIKLDITNRDVDLIAEGYDIVLQILPKLDQTGNYVARAFDLPPLLIVASPALVARHGLPRAPADLARIPAIGVPWPGNRGNVHLWHLTGPDSAMQRVESRLRFESEDIFAVMKAAIGGCGAALLPRTVCEEALDQGRLVQLLPSWSTPVIKLHLLYHSRKGLPMAQRSLIEFLSRRFQSFKSAGRQSSYNRPQLAAALSAPIQFEPQLE